MRIAIFLDHINFEYIHENIKEVLLFDVDDNLITAIGEDALSMDNIHYLVLWLLGKGIQVIYISSLDDRMRRFIEKAGISIKPLDEIRSNPILKSFLVRNN